MAYERFIDDRLLTSRDALNRTQIKIKLVEIDEAARDFSQRFGNRVLVRKILLTMRLTQTEEIEEKELNIEEIEPSSDRHFGPDKSACLCSALEEDEFLTPDLQLQPFLEKLVIPFLYGQVFYSLNRRWPWPEYAHGATGLLESYGRFPIPAKLDSFLQTLTECRESWSAIRAALLQKDYIKGHTACICEKKDQIRRCHPGALQGIRQLQHDIRDAKKVIP